MGNILELQNADKSIYILLFQGNSILAQTSPSSI